MERFPKKVNEMEDFQKGQHIIELIDLIESFESLFWHDWVDSYVLIARLF